MNASTLLFQYISKIILQVFTLSMVLELAKLGKEICLLSDAMFRNMALDQFIILFFALELSPIDTKVSYSLPNFEKNK